MTLVSRILIAASLTCGSGVGATTFLAQSMDREGVSALAHVSMVKPIKDDGPALAVKSTGAGPMMATKEVGGAPSTNVKVKLSGAPDEIGIAPAAVPGPGGGGVRLIPAMIIPGGGVGCGGC